MLLFDLVQLNRQARFLPARSALVNDAFFGGLVERGRDIFQSFGSIVLFSGSDQREIFFLERVEAGFDAAVLRVLAGTAPHAAFG